MKTVTLTVGEAGVPLRGLLYEQSPEMPQRDRRPCVIVCPGGAYAFRSDREADPVLAQFFAAGYHAFVLEYSVAGRDSSGAPLGMRPLSEVSAAVAAVRAHADEWGVYPDQIAVCGFSAGGHLTASLGVYWNDPRLSGRAGRPDALVLCYPVISSEEFISHGGSFDNLAGNDEALRAFFSLERHVTAQTPPAFLWHTAEDGDVPVENSMLFAMALKRAGVPLECHVFATGGHGMSLCSQDVGTPQRHNAAWVPLCVEWLDDRFHVRRY